MSNNSNTCQIIKSLLEELIFIPMNNSIDWYSLFNNIGNNINDNNKEITQKIDNKANNIISDNNIKNDCNNSNLINTHSNESQYIFHFNSISLRGNLCGFGVLFFSYIYKKYKIYDVLQQKLSEVNINQNINKNHISSDPIKNHCIEKKEKDNSLSTSNNCNRCNNNNQNNMDSIYSDSNINNIIKTISNNWQYWQFYVQIRKKLLKWDKMTNYEKEEIKRYGGVERSQMEKIIEEGIENMLNDKYQKNISSDYICYHEWFDFGLNNFFINSNEKIKKLNLLFSKIKNDIKCNNNQKSEKFVVFLFIGVIQHWILIIYDSQYKKLFEFDSYDGTKEIINIFYKCKGNKKLIDEETEKFIKKEEEDFKKYSTKDINSYYHQYIMNEWRQYICDIYNILDFIKNYYQKENFNLYEYIIKEKCRKIVDNYNNEKIEDFKDVDYLKKLNDWLIKDYPTVIFKEEINDFLKYFNIKKLSESNHFLHFFYIFCAKIKNMIEKNINNVENTDIKNNLKKFNELMINIINL